MTDTVKNRSRCAAPYECGNFVWMRSIAKLGLTTPARYLALRLGSQWQRRKNQYQTYLPARSPCLYLKPSGSSLFAQVITGAVELLKQQQAWRNRKVCLQTPPEQRDEELIGVPARAPVPA